MEEEMSFTIKNDQGMDVECDVLSIINDDNNNIYLIYTDYTLNENEEFNIYVSQMVNEGEEFKLTEVENKDLIPGFQEIYDDIRKELNLKNKNEEQ